MTVTIQLRQAKLDDAVLLLSWRNDDKSRQSSHNTKKVKFDDHYAWLTETLSNPNRKLYIAEYLSEKIGTVRADFITEDDVWELSWTLSPEKRGQGLAKYMVLALVNSIQGAVKAEVKKDNLASIRVAEYAGLKLSSSNSAVLTFFRNALTN